LLHQVEYAGAKLSLGYTYTTPDKFEVTIGEEKLAVQLISVEKNKLTCVIDGHRQSFYIARSSSEVFVQNATHGTFRFKDVPRFTEPGAAASSGGYIAPMPGEIIKVLVKAGDKVQSGKGLLVMSSMKMETTIEAHSDGEVEEVFVADKQFVEADTVLLKMKE
jgi:biotin carboxyl carrier protein